MEKYYQETIEGNKVTLWDEAEGIGLQFTKGDTLQAYTSSVLYRNETKTQTEEGLKHLNEVEQRLTDEARKRYPKEFATIK